MPTDSLLADRPDLYRRGAAEAAPAVTIVVCRTCRFADDPHAEPRPGAILAERVREVASAAGIGVREANCLGNCKRSLSAVILRDQCWSYVFGDLDAGSAADLLAGARLFAASSDGLMPFRARPLALKRGLVARVPSFANLEELP